MPDEPRKSIEELLQASAKTRRAEFGIDPKMPNPMRARLHEEIARATREEEPQSRTRWNWFAISWPLGTVAAAVLVVAFVMSRSHELQSPTENRQVAAHQDERAKRILQPAAPQAVGKDTGENESKKFADVATEAKPEAPAAAAMPQPGNVGSFSTYFAQTQKTQGNIAQQFPRDLPRTAPQASKLKQSVNVLNTFQLQQNGDQIRVVDADGSTYTGKIEQAEAVHRAAGGSAAQDAVSQTLKNEKENLAARSEQDLAQQNNSQFYFRATGYNNSLQKRIVFEGNYIAIPAQSKMPDGNAAANEHQSPARIVGTAKVTGESLIEVDATSVPQ